MPTARDWIERARKAGKDPVERARCLRAAEALVEYPSDWPTLAEEWVKLGPDGHAEARRCAERAVELGGPEVFVHRAAATVFARQLDDLARAREVLGRCREVLAARAETRASDWGYLAGGHAVIVGDLDAARACLDEGLTRATRPSVDDLCALARDHAEHLGDRATARALIERAAVLAEARPTDARDSGGWWTLANAWRHALDDADEAWRVLERGLAWADSVSRCKTIGRAVACHAERDASRRPLLRACVVKAETLAVTAEDWLDVADAWHEHRLDPAAVRRCLERAQAADGDGAARVQIAHGYRHWLEDAETADRLAPRGATPADMIVVHQRLEGWTSEPARLLDLVRARLTPRMLRTMAEADYGSDVDKHLAALVDIQTTGLIPRPLRWHPREVVELTRWREGVTTDHLARAFACTILCLDSAGPDYHDGVEQTIAVLIESCLVLGPEVLDAGIGLLVTMCQAMEDFREELAFCYLGLLVAAAARDRHDPRLPELSARVIAAADTRGPERYPRPEWGWLLGTTYFDQRHALWRRLAAEHLVGPAHLTDVAARLRPA